MRQLNEEELLAVAGGSFDKPERPPKPRPEPPGRPEPTRDEWTPLPAERPSPPDWPGPDIPRPELPGNHTSFSG